MNTGNVLAFLLIFSVSCVSGDSIDSHKKRPVAKVITLLKEMIDQLAKEGEEDEEVYDSMGCWCETNDKEKTKAIADGEERIATLRANIDDMAAKSAQLNTEIEDLERELEKNSDALATATSLRKKQLAEFNEEEKSMLQSISALKAAVIVMQSATGDTTGIANLLARELRVHDGLLRETMRPAQRKFLQDFTKDPDGFLQTDAGFIGGSREIWGLLRQMKESFSKNLAASQREEAENQHAFNSLRSAKEDEIFAGKSQVDTKNDELATTDTKVARSREDLEDTQNTLTVDTKFLADLKERCASLDAEYELRTKSRQMEIQATSKALEFLTSDEAHELLGRTLSFAQVSVFKRGTQRSQAAALIGEARQRSGDPRLGVLQVNVRLNAFGKVKKTIEDMIDMLTQEKDDEMKHKDFCIDALNQNERDTENKQRDKSDMAQKIEDLKMSVDETGKAIEGLQTEIAEMQLQMKRAGSDREKENRDFQLTIADQRATQKLLGAALSVLKGFYEKKSLLQQSKVGTRWQQTPDSLPSFKPMEKSAAGGGVMGMIQNIIRDAKAMENEALRGEQDSQQGYVEFMKNTNDSIEEKSKDLLNKGAQKAKLEQDLVRSKEEAGNILQELEQLFNGDADLHKSCDFILKNSEERDIARDEEIEALKESIALFSGASFGALLQGHSIDTNSDDDTDPTANDD